MYAKHSDDLLFDICRSTLMTAAHNSSFYHSPILFITHTPSIPLQFRYYYHPTLDMFTFLQSWKYLFFLRSAEPAQPVPAGLHRYWLETSHGPIEILAAEPETLSDPGAPAIVFCHGGMGGAWVWTEYMQYLRKAGVRCYAVSLRGHGDSW